MRVAYVTETYSPEINGIALSVGRTVRFLRERGHFVDLIRPRQRGETVEASPGERHELLTAGLRLPIYPDRRCGLAFPWTLARRFAHTRPDLVHIASAGPLGRAALLAAEHQDLPVTTDFCTNVHAYSHRPEWLQPVIYRYLRKFHNRAQRTFVPSRMLHQQLAASGFRNLELVGRGVDTQLFSPEHRDPQLRGDWDAAGDDQLVMLYVGRLVREKNVALALRAFEMARAFHPRMRMVVVGDGPLRRQLESSFPSVRFVGTRRGVDLARHYASADLFVFPSQSETFGNVVLEAMASGLAVIGFDAAAVADLIATRENGIAVVRGDNDQRTFVEAVCGCAAARRRELAALGRNARETAQRTSWEKVLGGLEVHLQQVAFKKFLDVQRNVVMA